MTTAAICIPFRDRGLDPLRQADLNAVLDWWADFPAPVHVVSDGRTGDAQFNRSRAYNLGRAIAWDADVIVYSESDMLLPYEQITEAIELAAQRPGLVVPFTRYCYLSPDDSIKVRGGAHPTSVTPESTMENGRSIGAVNVVSQATLDLVGGYTELTEGAWFDDNIMAHAFEVCAGSTRWVTGDAHHLYHLPGFKGDHLSAEDRAATARNKALWIRSRRIKDPARLRALLHRAPVNVR